MQYKAQKNARRLKRHIFIYAEAGCDRRRRERRIGAMSGKRACYEEKQAARACEAFESCSYIHATAQIGRLECPDPPLTFHTSPLLATRSSPIQAITLLDALCTLRAQNTDIHCRHGRRSCLCSESPSFRGILRLLSKSLHPRAMSNRSLDRFPVMVPQAVPLHHSHHLTPIPR